MIYASALHRFRQLLHALLADRNCLLCQQCSSQSICAFCRSDYAGFDMRQCQGNLLNDMRIRRYLKQVDFDRFVALGPYQWPLSAMVSRLKFSAKPIYAKAMAQLFTEKQLTSLNQSLPEVLLPVPLHPRRYAQRQYNQAALLATHISQFTRIPCQNNAIKRVRATPPQTCSAANARLTNLKQAFALGAPLTQYKHVAIIDDVVTTGATVSAVSRLLRRHYPHLRVEVWALAVSLERQ